MSKHNQYVDLIHEFPEVIVAASNDSLKDEQKLQLRKKVDAYKQIYCELGSGSGMHLLDRAEADPDGLYIGFELRFKRSYKTAEKSVRRGLTNLMVVRTNARLLPTLFERETIDGVYINFPDPWDRERWAKHRLLVPEFIEQLFKLLTPTGFVAYKTDHQARFEEVLQFFEEATGFETAELSRDLLQSEFAGDNVPTEFEKLFKSKGLPIFYLRAKKLS